MVNYENLYLIAGYSICFIYSGLAPHGQKTRLLNSHTTHITISFVHFRMLTASDTYLSYIGIKI